MASIIVALIIGVIIGIIIKPTEKAKKITSNFQFIGVVLLLFSMGAGLGLNKDLLSNLKNIGITGITFALLTTVFSIIVVYFATTVYGRMAK